MPEPIAGHSPHPAAAAAATSAAAATDATATPILEARQLCKSFGALTVTNQVSIRLMPGERRVVLGPNGAGKTTLFNLLAGTIAPTSGQIRMGGREVTHLSMDARARLGLARSYQKNNLFDELTVRENLSLAAMTAQRRNASLLRDSLRDPSVRDAVGEVAELVHLTHALDQPCQDLSYGERRQLEVGIAMATRPRLLLLDEPTSGISPGATRAFHRLVQSLPRELTLLIIEHDMDLAFDIADTVTVLNYGQVVFEGTPQATRESELVREIYIGAWAPQADHGGPATAPAQAAAATEALAPAGLAP